MSIRTRIDTDIVYQDGDATTITVGSLSEHIAPAATVAAGTTASVGTSAVQIVGTPPLSTLAVKTRARVCCGWPAASTCLRGGWPFCRSLRRSRCLPRAGLGHIPASGWGK